MLDARRPTTTLTDGGERCAAVSANQDTGYDVDILKMNLDEARSIRVGESGATAGPPGQVTEKQVTGQKQVTGELRDLARHCLAAVSGRYA